MSPKPRKPEHKGLPKRWRFKHNAYYYRVPDSERGKWDGKTEFRLGKSLPDAYRTWAERLEMFSDVRTVGALLDRYALQVVPKKAYKSQESNLHSIRKLRPVFEKMPLASVKPRHVNRYRDLRSKEGKTAANRDIEVLSHAFSMAVEWGYLDYNHLRGQIRKNRTQPRRRYVEDWEIIEALKVASPLIRAYVNLKLLTGLRRGDLLSIQKTDLTEQGIRVQARKTLTSTGKAWVIAWSPALRSVVDEVFRLRRETIAPWLFHTRTGQPYIKPTGKADGFDSIWQRFMAKALAETKLEARFTEHDLRAKVASDAEPEHARELMGHASPEITNRVYRRRERLVQPAKVLLSR